MKIAKTLLAAVLGTATLAACATSEAERPKPQKDVLMKSVTIPVEGMACDSCAARIQKNLARIDGVVAADVSFDAKHAVVQYDARKLEPKRLASAISGLGFQVGTPVEATP